MKFFSISLLLFASMAYARKPSPLPDFSLVTTDGKTVNSAQLHLPNRWLLVYVHDYSEDSDIVLKTFQNEPPSALMGKMFVIIGGASAKDIAPIADRYPHLKSVTWYADPTWQALRAMKLPGSPAALGVKQDTVQWMLTGSLPDKNRLASILRTWKNNKDK